MTSVICPSYLKPSEFGSLSYEDNYYKSWEMVVPRNQNDSTAVTVLFMMVSGGGGGGSPEIHNHLHYFERVQLQDCIR